MPAQSPIRIASVNMRKRNAVTHALLNSDNDTNLFLLQEPWFNKIGTASVTEPVIRQIDAPIRFLLRRPRRRPS
jgi:hypothetical protein